jgi:hypothetical protein
VLGPAHKVNRYGHILVNGVFGGGGTLGAEGSRGAQALAKLIRDRLSRGLAKLTESILGDIKA